MIATVELSDSECNLLGQHLHSLAEIWSIKVLRMSDSSSLYTTYFDVFLFSHRDANVILVTKLLSFCFSGDDFSLIQQEIFMVKECKHCNIVAYFGSYLR